MNVLVHQLQSLASVTPIQGQAKVPISTEDKTNHISFSSVLKNAIEEVNKVETEADDKAEKLAQGKADDLHDVMLSAQKAKITVEASVQVQQKVIDAYNEMMRMQV